MLFVVVGQDSSDAPRLREVLLQAHLDWVVGVMDRIRVAGPLTDAHGRPCASLYVLEAEDEHAARRFLEGDPYYSGGVWREVSFRPFVAAAGTWTGGPSWLK